MVLSMNLFANYEIMACVFLTLFAGYLHIVKSKGLYFICFDFWFQVRSIVETYRCAPFVPVSKDSNMLSVLLLLSKYRLRNVPVIEPGKPDLVNYITQSAVVQGLVGCQGRDWFDCIAARPITDLGLPYMSSHEVKTKVHIYPLRSLI